MENLREFHFENLAHIEFLFQFCINIQNFLSVVVTNLTISFNIRYLLIYTEVKSASLRQ